MADFGLYWWRPKRDWINLGDEISPLVLAHVTGRALTHAPDHLCDGIAIGSVFNPRRARAKKRATPLFVWGSGTLAPAPCDMAHLSVIMAALRGPRTHGQIAGCPDLPYGDPGLFVREIWPKAAPGDKIGLIPHHAMLKSPQVKALSDGLEGVEILDFTLPDIADTLARLSACRLVLSSSLHGLIIADSYGIPSLFWNEGGEANEWKYRDYFEGVGREDFAALSGAEITARLAAGPVNDLPFSRLAEARVASTLAGLRQAARLMPEGSFERAEA